MIRQNRTATQTHQVSVARLGESRALAETRGHRLTRDIKKVAGETGFNAAKTLLAALGACLLTNVNAIGEKMRLRSDKARIEFNAERRDEPPASFGNPLRIDSQVPPTGQKTGRTEPGAYPMGHGHIYCLQRSHPQGELVSEP